ncbi:MAG TPA: hypothetical protein PLK14_01240 [Sediminibacterium sp.]|nr:hypothetical protein [Sediminibacterium sp.]HQS53690.1 hypothetical protein [Sediminibacterium sp.]
MKQFLLLFLFLPLISFAQTHIGSVEISNIKAIPIPRSFQKQIDSFNRTNTYYNLLNSSEKELFYWMNYSRSNPKQFWDSCVLPIIKQFPNLNGSNAKSLEKDLAASEALPLYSLNKSLIGTAQKHALDNMNQGRINHQSADGKQFDQRMREILIKRCASENLASGPPNMLFALVLLYLDIGVADTGHRKCLLTPSFTELGLGARSKTGETFYICQDFACYQQ